MVLSSRTDTVAGLSPQFIERWQGPHLVEWQEAGHVRSFELDKVLAEDADRFEFRDTLGITYELRPMTLELYEKHVRRRTVGQKKYDRLEDLLAAMRIDW